jgi:hypothetical protein
MSPRTRSRLGASFVSALVAILTLPAAAGAAGSVDLRVVDNDGSTLAEYRQYTGTTKIKSSRKATCFGEGNEGSGDSFKVRGRSLIGSLVDAAEHDSALRPLLITDKFNVDLGPGLCGVGGDQGEGGQYWNVRSNQVDAFNLATDPVSNGDDVLIRQVTFPPGNELVLKGPASATPGEPFRVKVTQHDSEGTASPAVGATVPDAAAPTNANGKTMVTSAKGVAELRATLAGTTPSNQLDVCVSANPKRCGDDENLVIFGSDRGERIAGDSGNDKITARGGDDRINLTAGGRDVVNCGGGKDTVVLAKGDRNDKIAKNCERVVRK